MSTLPDVKALDLAVVWAADPPEMKFVLPGLAVGTVGMVVAAGGTGKTFAMLATALGVAIGRDVGKIWGEDPVRGGAVFLSLEDPDVALRSRIHAFLPLLSEEERQLACESLNVLPFAGHGISFASAGEKDLELTGAFKKLEEHLTKIKPRICVIDTLNRALGGISENDAGAMGWLIGQVERMARVTGCAIVLCHHVSKQALTMASAGEAHAARGSSVITDNARWQCNLSTPGEKDKAFAGMSEVKRRSFVRLDFSKTNYGPPLAARWLKRNDVGVLGHDPDIGVTVAKARKLSAKKPPASGGTVASVGAQANVALANSTMKGTVARRPTLTGMGLQVA